MTALPMELFQLFDAERIVELSVYENKLTCLPSEMCQWSNLTHLWASHNALQSLPSAMSNLTQLRYLSLEGNTALPFRRWSATLRGAELVQAVVGEMALHYGRVERCRERCVRACVAVLGMRCKSALWTTHVPRDVARIIARMLMESREDPRWYY